MIHNSSKAPVLIKKISLKIWSLRDEIETYIQNELSIDPEKIINLEDVRKVFHHERVSTPIAQAVDSGEDEMAKAMRGEISEDEISNSPNLDQNAQVIEFITEPPPIPADKIALAKMVLAEIGMDKMFFFTNKKFTEGQSIVIQFCIPKTFIINADVLYCRPYNIKSRIISENNYAFRALVKFTFLKEGERALLRQFIQSIEIGLPADENKNDKNKEDNSFSELDELGI